MAGKARDGLVRNGNAGIFNRRNLWDLKQKESY